MDLYFQCVACGDSRTVSVERSHCLCGASSARAAGNTVVVAGPGRVGSGRTSDRDQVVVVRPSVAVGT